MFSKKRPLPEILPAHVAVIMDGNGRWAAKRGLPRMAGHAAGSENFRRIATFCQKIGIKHLTAYAFSTENWKRPEQEVSGIMDLVRKYVRESIESMEKDNINLRFFGDLTEIPDDIRELIKQTDEISKRYQGMQVHVCLNYGSRDEILRAVRSCIENPPETLDEKSFGARLDSVGVPDPDLCIRPSGEVRLSNFLLWQLAYSELVFTKTLWPDFSEKELTDILWEYSGRQRRFGGI